MNPSTATIANVGESGAIDRLIRRIRKGRDPSASFYRVPILVDAGDDAAAWESQADTYLFTTDAMVEGVHFTRDTLSWEDLGWKVMAVNVSDIAAMGGRPRFALITLGLTPDFPLNDLDSIYDGMIAMARETWPLTIIGGDMVKSPTVFVNVALVGSIQSSPMTRDAACPGDLVAVTSPLGSSAGGLALLQNKTATGADADHLRQAHRRPRPHLLQADILMDERVLCGMDVSDGLLADLAKLCLASNVAAQVEAHRIPTLPALVRHFPDTYLEKALSGGEDYVLLFTAPSDAMNRVTGRIPEAAVVGRITDGQAGKVTVLDENGKDVTPTQSGWDHYR